MMNHFKTIVGIDPGKSGAVSIYRFNNLTIIKMPETINELVKELKLCTEPIIFIEQVSHWANEDPRRKMNIAKLERQFNTCINAIDILGLPYCKISSQKWRKVLRLPKVKDYSERKKANVVAARGMTNLHKITLQTADAFLINMAGKHLLEFDMPWVKTNIQNYD